MNPPSACPKCGAALNAGATACPACHQVLAAPPIPAPRRGGFVLWALALLLLPILVAAVIRSEGAIVASTFLLAPACGLAAGVLLGLKLGSTVGAKIGLAFGLSVVCVICTEVLMAFGCGSGLLNLKMNFH